MKKAILGILMLCATPVASSAENVPKAYLAKSVLAKCGATITPHVANLIEGNYYIVYNAWQAGKIRLNFRLGKLGAEEYCTTLKSREEELLELQ